MDLLQIPHISIEAKAPHVLTAQALSQETGRTQHLNSQPYQAVLISTRYTYDGGHQLHKPITSQTTLVMRPTLQLLESLRQDDCKCRIHLGYKVSSR